MDFTFGTGATEGDFRAGGYHWQLDWLGGQVTHRALEAARLAINAANEAGADDARATHPWDNQTFQTEESVFVRPAHYNHRTRQFWGSWGVHDIPREPLRINEGNYPKYEGRPLTTKDVALLLEFGFHTQAGEARRYPWLYPAWDRERHTVMPLVKIFYDSLPSNFRYRMGGTGQFMNIRDVFPDLMP